MTIDAATITSSTAAIAVLYQIWRQIRADRKQDRADIAAAKRDVVLREQGQKLDTITVHVNGMNDKIEKLAYKSGGDDERANPTTQPQK